MADPILHIKDAYYFELPKPMWRYDYSSFDEVPASLKFLVDDAQHQHMSIGEFNQELSGKIVIPQPFGTLKNLYEKDSGWAISKFMVLEVVIAALIALVFIRLANRMSASHRPVGRGWNLLEVFLVFIRDQVVRPAIGETHHHDDHGHGNHSHGDHGHGTHAAHDDHRTEHHSPVHHDPSIPKVGHSADRFLPLFWTMFFFILTCNLFGLLPWLGSPTGAFGVTFALACITFGTTLLMGAKTFGPLKFIWYQVPKMDMSWTQFILMMPLLLMILAIELLGLCIKHAILSVRLLANMVAGHLVLLGILGLIIAGASYSTGLFGTVAGISVVSSTLFSLLELFVAFLQAYIFTFLSALFIGAAMHRH